MKKNQLKTHFYVIADSNLKDTDLGLSLDDWLESLWVGYKYSAKTYDNSILWMSAKEDHLIDKDNQNRTKYVYNTEVLLLYYNSLRFIEDFTSGKIYKDLDFIKFFNGKIKIKTLIIFQSVGDTLYCNPSVTRDQYDKFLVELTVAYNYDYVELKTIPEWVTLIQEIQETLDKKSSKINPLNDGTYGVSKGGKWTKKATMEGLNDHLSKYWINMLMSIPGVSENKAIAIVKKYPTFQSLMSKYESSKLSETRKMSLLNDEVEVQTSVGDDRSQKIGKKISERVCNTLRNTDPSVMIG